MLHRLVVVGVGLIGGSFAYAHKTRGSVAEVIGMGRSQASLERALALGLIDRIMEHPAHALQGCDLVLIAAPVGQTGPILSLLAPHLGPRTVVTDAGSTKVSVVEAARAALGPKIGQFVPAHPIAGGEASGPDAAQARLFERRQVVLTPLPENSSETLERVALAWRGCGADVLSMSAAAHDAALAAISHLPHLVAFALMAHVAGAPAGEAKLALAGSGFRDVTRIAASNPEMWRDIVLANRPAVLAELDAYRALLDAIRAQIEKGDGDALEALFADARAARMAMSDPPRGGRGP